jgi:hypothetical protein
MFFLMLGDFHFFYKKFDFGFLKALKIHSIILINLFQALENQLAHQAFFLNY